jgi:integrase/recombinase XerD
MNRSSSSSLSLERAITGFLNFKTAEGLSPRTVFSYRHMLEQWVEYAGNVPIVQISEHDIGAYLVFMRIEYKPRRFGGSLRPLSPKTLRNIWVALASFFAWAKSEFQIDNPMKNIPAPRTPKTVTEPFSQEELTRMLKACVYSREANTFRRKKFVMRRPTADRDRAILLTLLDSGIRASEFCALCIGDFDPKSGKLEIHHGMEGGAKGGKGRIVYLGKTARHALWRYLASREDGEEMAAPLFIAGRNRRFNPVALRHLIKRIGKKSGIQNAYPHKFRHTFAITYLRSGGDVFTLQALLGHGSLDMVRHYAKIAQLDVEHAHRKASPVDNWRL